MNYHHIICIFYFVIGISEKNLFDFQFSGMELKFQLNLITFNTSNG